MQNKVVHGFFYEDIQNSQNTLLEKDSPRQPKNSLFCLSGCTASNPLKSTIIHPGDNNDFGIRFPFIFLTYHPEKMDLPTQSSSQTTQIQQDSLDHNIHFSAEQIDEDKTFSTKEPWIQVITEGPSLQNNFLLHHSNALSTRQKNPPPPSLPNFNTSPSTNKDNQENCNISSELLSTQVPAQSPSSFDVVNTHTPCGPCVSSLLPALDTALRTLFPCSNLSISSLVGYSGIIPSSLSSQLKSHNNTQISAPSPDSSLTETTPDSDKNGEEIAPAYLYTQPNIYDGRMVIKGKQLLTLLNECEQSFGKSNTFPGG